MEKKNRPVKTQSKLVAQFMKQLSESETFDAGAYKSGFGSGYAAGWDDCCNAVSLREPVMAWAIVDRERQKVRFETVKPTELAENEVLIPLYVRPEQSKLDARDPG